MVEYTTVGGYVAIIAVVGTAYYLNKRDNKNGRNKGNKVERSSIERRASNAVASAGRSIKSKTERVEAAVSSAAEGNTSQDGEKKGKKKQGTKKQALPATKVAVPNSTNVSKKTEVDDDTDNLAFARQLSSAQRGTVAPAKTSSAAKQKSVKQSKAGTSQSNGSATAQVASDGDDDLSPANSPRLAATGSKNDVSDMLEAPAAGPSILRISSPTQPASTKEKKPAAKPETAETKKQRQNRKKAEEKKAAREADELERKKLEEQQRRTARIAEGRAAKDGQAFLAANPPSKSAWTAASAAKNGNTTSGASDNELLDTFVETPKPAPVSSAPKGIKANNIGAIPSEEDQLRMALEDTEWQDVPSKKSKKTAAKAVADNIPAHDAKENVRPPTAPAIEIDQQAPKEIPASKEPSVSKKVQVQEAAAKPVTSFVADDEWEVS